MLRDVVRTITLTVDVPEYIRCWGMRFEYFGVPLRPSSLLGVSRLADPDFPVEIEAMRSSRWSGYRTRRGRPD